MFKSTYLMAPPWPVCEAMLLQWPSVQQLELSFFLFDRNTLAGLLLLKEHRYVYFHNQVLVARVGDCSQRSSETWESRWRFGLTERGRFVRPWHWINLKLLWEALMVSSPILQDLWSNLASNRPDYRTKWWIPESRCWGAARELVPQKFENKGWSVFL